MIKKKTEFTEAQIGMISNLERELLRDLSEKYISDLSDLLSIARTVYEFEGMLTRFCRHAVGKVDSDISTINYELSLFVDRWKSDAERQSAPFWDTEGRDSFREY